MVADGAAVSTACTDGIATLLLFPSRSWDTLSVSYWVSFAFWSAPGVMTRVYSVPETGVNVPLVPPLMVMSAAVKPVTDRKSVE